MPTSITATKAVHSNMLPSAAVYDTQNTHRRETVFECELSLRDIASFKAPPNFQDERRIQFRRAVALAASTAFGVRVLAVACSIRPRLWMLSQPLSVAARSALWSSVCAVVRAARATLWMQTHRVAVAGERAPLEYHVAHVGGLRSEEKVRGVDTVPHVAFVQDVKTLRNRPARHLVRNLVCALATFRPDVELAVPVRVEPASPQPTRFSLVDARPEFKLLRLCDSMRVHCEALLKRLIHSVAGSGVSAPRPLYCLPFYHNYA